MITITDLSQKIISSILIYKDIHIVDVVNFTSTCKRFNTMLMGNKFWERKFFERWPLLKDTCKRKWYKLCVDVKEQVIERIKCRKELMHYISQLNELYYYRSDLSHFDLRGFNPMFLVQLGAHPMKYYYFEDELFNMLDRNVKTEDINFVHMYYARKILKYMKQCYLTEKWLTFLNLPAEKQILEKAQAVMLQWLKLETRVSFTSVSMILDDIADLAFDKIIRKFPKHPISSISGEQLYYWRNYNITDNYWKGDEAKQIMNAINVVLVERFNAYSINEILPEFVKDDEDIQGLRLYTTILFQAVTRRLGIRCDILILSSFLILVWRENCAEELSKTEKFYHIHVLHQKLFGSSNCCTVISSLENCSENISKNMVTPTQLMLNMSKLFPSHWKDFFKLRTILELHYMIDPHNIDTILQLSHFYIAKSNMDFTDIKLILVATYDKDTITEEQKSTIRILLTAIKKIPMQQPFHITPKQRTKSSKLKYAIGMIIKIKDFDINVGVIYRWEIQLINKKSPYNKRLSKLCSKNTGAKIMYGVFCNGNISVLVDQDRIIPLKSETVIQHEEIGRYFTSFKKTHYVPNKMMEISYPDDTIVREQWASRLTP